MRLVGLTLFGFVLVAASHAQSSLTSLDTLPPATDSVRTLREVHITDHRLRRFTSGDKIVSVRTQAVNPVDHSNLSRLLLKYAGLNVRSYGPAGLSTASLRGTGSNHTAVFWEGINLQSSMNGSLDLTLVPVSFTDEVAVQYGGSGSLFGSGTLGGAIHLTSDGPVRSPGANGQVYQQFGSFGRRYTGVNAGYEGKQLTTQVRAFTHRADYDFPFYNEYTNREERRRNAGLRQQGVLAENQWRPTARHTIAAKYWYQDNLVQVPNVTAAGGEARATQADDFHRAVLRWQYQQPRQQWQVRTALLFHRLVYDDKVRLLSTSRSTSWITEAENTYYLTAEHWWHTGINHTYETANVDSYAQDVQRHRTALFLSYRALLGTRLETTIGARETLIDGRWSPFLPSLGLAYSLSPIWQLRSKIARSYRVPTFNDLYWAGAGGEGNPDLQPETGWSGELGAQVSTLTSARTKALAELTIFSNSVNQWISWVPVTSSVWTPINVEQVWARGVELNGSIHYPLADTWAAHAQGNYSYTRSTKERIAAGGAPAELHKQLIYTPYHQASASLSIDYRSLSLGYVLVLVGEQFTSASNSQTLPAYSTSDVSATYRWGIFPKHQLLVSGQINNLTDHAYSVRQGYPMPGRHYQVSIVYQFNQ